MKKEIKSIDYRFSVETDNLGVFEKFSTLFNSLTVEEKKSINNYSSSYDVNYIREFDNTVFKGINNQM